MIGEPVAGNPHARFDEGRQETCVRARACLLLYEAPVQVKSNFLTGPERGKRSALGRRFARAAAQRRRRCPRLFPGGGNGKGGELNTSLPRAIFHAAFG